MTQPAAPWDIPGQVAQAINDWLMSVARSALDAALSAIQGMLTLTPHFERIPEVQQLWNLTRNIADAFLILIALTGGILLMVSSTVQTRYTVKLVISRLLVAAVLANLGQSAFAMAIDLNNALSSAFLATGLNGTQLSSSLQGQASSNLLQGPVYVLLSLLAALLVLALLLVYVGRLAILILALVASPIAAICYALPNTEGASWAWWRLTAAALLIQPVNALLLGVAMKVFFSGAVSWGVNVASALIEILVAIVLLYLLIQTPRWIYTHMIAPETYHRARSAVGAAVSVAKLIAKVA
jgi:hypothetical protein